MNYEIKYILAIKDWNLHWVLRHELVLRDEELRELDHNQIWTRVDIGQPLHHILCELPIYNYLIFK